MNNTKSNLPWRRGWQECGGGEAGPSSLSSPSTSHIYWLITEDSLEMSQHQPQQDRWDTRMAQGRSQDTDFLTGLQPRRGGHRRGDN